MKITLCVVAIVLAALLSPSASQAVYPSCTECGVSLNSGNFCTCPGTAPHFIFTLCSNYPAACQVLPPGPAALKEAFLKSLATQPAPASTSSPTR
jgi:hypothetical protein